MEPPGVVLHVQETLGPANDIEREPRGRDFEWEVRYQALPTDHGPVALRLVLDELEDVHVYLLEADPRRRGAGKQVMESLRAYCEPRGLPLSTAAITEQSRHFFQHFVWLDVADNGMEFFSNWDAPLKRK
jgi:GNAT superfamily N-acetyltransferase